jgi:hypothetical protein
MTLFAMAGSAFVDGTRPPAPVPLKESPAPSQVIEVPPAVEVAAAAIEQAETEKALDLPSIDDEARDRLAEEMDRWKTRHPRQLVEVIANLAEVRPLPVAPTYLLSIAWSETRGKVLAVSPAGAAGLAQATPAAYMLEGFPGKLYVTTDYLMGTRAYIMKKPLGDAMSISADLLRRNTPATRKQAREMTERALELRREGMEELEALKPVGTPVFEQKIAELDAYNLEMLQKLASIIDRGAPRAELGRYNAQVKKDYTYLRNLQRTGWERYARSLEARRDSLLEERYGQKASTVILSRPYEAGEFLGEALDARFSPKQMAEFLAKHLETKQQQARELGIEETDLDQWTAALYNGGAVNVRRMQAGLIDSLRETQKYMKAVPARSALLEKIL